MEYNSDEEPKITSNELLKKTNNDLQDSAKTEIVRE